MTGKQEKKMEESGLMLRFMKFKMDLLSKMPFYGDVLMNIPLVETREIRTAATDGMRIMYNPAFMRSMTTGEQNFVLMHEVMHILMLHFLRGRGRKHEYVNIAQDLIVNKELELLMTCFKQAAIPFTRPKNGIFGFVSNTDTMENVYEKILADNKNGKKDKVKLRRSYVYHSPQLIEIGAPDMDVLFPQLNDEEAEKELERHVKEILVHATGAKDRTPFGHYYVNKDFIRYEETSTLPWRTILKQFLMEETSDEVSYVTPERKYIHMDLILPGHGLKEESIEEIWAFVDSSGSVGSAEMNEFLTQLYQISREFKCVMNVAYWDTAVSDVYEKLKTEKDVREAIPHHTGGTDINCVYEWLEKNRKKPEVMLILTDGAFGILKPEYRKPSLRKKTILVISSNGWMHPGFNEIGKVAKIKK